jgi:hypothetical protein
MAGLLHHLHGRLLDQLRATLSMPGCCSFSTLATSSFLAADDGRRGRRLGLDGQAGGQQAEAED